MKLTLQQLEAHLWGAANILRGKTAGQDYENYILSLMFYKRLCDQWEREADDAGAKAGEFFTPPEVVDTLVRILEPRPGDSVYDPTSGSGGMLAHTADYLREHGHHATSARYCAQEMNWGNAAIGKINSVLHGLEADIKAGTSTIIDPQFLEDGKVRKFSLVLATFSFLRRVLVAEARQQTDDKKIESKDA